MDKTKTFINNKITTKMKKDTIYYFLLFLLVTVPTWASNHQPEFSTAGFFYLENCGRDVYSMNPAWRFHKGKIKDAEVKNFDDTNWKLVSLPNGIEYLPLESSGCINYQGEVWYRKHFTPEKDLKNKKIFLHFEAIMGKSKIYVNGKLLKEHFGGYLPVVVDITEAIEWNNDNVIAVWADNSDDPSYPPGKAQDVLDYAYFGGIYRDCWLIAHHFVYITNPNYENEKASGGLFVAFDEISEELAEVQLKIHLRNETKNSFSGIVEYTLLQPNGSPATNVLKEKVRLQKGKASSFSSKLTVKQPKLWTPSTPNLYNLLIRIIDNQGNVIDGYRQRIGIRSLEFKGKDGFWLNGKPYGKPLIGANRHQDFAIVGNAVPNSIHWRDAKKLKEVGMEIIRNAHCPQDPAFMDACDELGLFVIVNTPGWQFWSDEPIFAQRVYNDIRNVVRRDRNHPCVWLWEPILNETWYPEEFAHNTRNIIDEEYPFPYCYSGCDSHARGHEYFPVYFAHPAYMLDATKEIDPSKTYFTREWGDNVDDWNSHNSPSRVARNWGEQAMLIQAQHYAKPDYPVTNYNELYKQSPQHVGGCLWHSFDHQRGYHPDPFYGGLMDVFRQPKYSYYMFMAQRPVINNGQIAGSGPMVYIAHEMTPFSNKDVTVYSNCDEVRLTFNKGGKTYIYKKNKNEQGMPSPIIIFPNVFNFMEYKALSMERHQEDVFLLAEGLIDGKVVATHKVVPALRPEKISLWIDNEGVDLKADGSDFVTVIAAITDKNGTIKHLNNYEIKFEIEGPGKIIGNKETFTNPSPVRWGTAPIIVQSTTNPGNIKLRASVVWQGIHTPLSSEIIITTQPSNFPWIADDEELKIQNTKFTESDTFPNYGNVQIDKEKQISKNQNKLKEVEKQQSDFGE